MKPSAQPLMRRSCEAGDYAELADAMPKVRGVAPYRAIKLLTHRPAETLREYDEALYVENGSGRSSHDQEPLRQKVEEYS